MDTQKESQVKKERYQVTLNKIKVDKILELQEKMGAASNLSSLIDKLLADWLLGALAMEPFIDSMNSLQIKNFEKQNQLKTHNRAGEGVNAK